MVQFGIMVVDEKLKIGALVNSPPIVFVWFPSLVFWQLPVAPQAKRD